jgi:8-oxo-dGTP diphosphatase
MGIRVAKVILMNNEKKFLLCLRDDKPTIPFPNHWSMLGGGAEQDETLIEALKREIKEEIDYDLNSPIIFLGCFEDLSSKHTVYVYKSKINKKLDELKLTEGQRLGYFNFEEAMQLRLPDIMKNFLIKNKGKLDS